MMETDYISRQWLLTEYDKRHHGPPGGARKMIEEAPPADVRPVPAGGIGEMSDGYHTFNGLYYQRMVLFAALVKQNKDSAWKSHRHEDGELCFGGGWFIVGIDTPEGSYTYHYEDKDWDLFDCEELPVGKHWDGHTEDDVTRLLSLPEMRPVVRGAWEQREVYDARGNIYELQSAFCPVCKRYHTTPYLYNFTHYDYCPNCGAKMDEIEKSIDAHAKRGRCGRADMTGGADG